VDLAHSCGVDHPNVATVLNNLGLVLQATNRFADAEAHYRRALSIYEKGFGPEHPEVAKQANNLALVLYATNRVLEAESLIDSCTATRLRLGERPACVVVFAICR
jgi:Flp pilus assembly protein TadD